MVFIKILFLSLTTLLNSSVLRLVVVKLQQNLTGINKAKKLTNYE
jgi:hypothetical protein